MDRSPWRAPSDHQGQHATSCQTVTQVPGSRRVSIRATHWATRALLLLLDSVKPPPRGRLSCVLLWGWIEVIKYLVHGRWLCRIHCDWGIFVDFLWLMSISYCLRAKHAEHNWLEDFLPSSNERPRCAATVHTPSTPRNLLDTSGPPDFWGTSLVVLNLGNYNQSINYFHIELSLMLKSITKCGAAAKGTRNTSLDHRFL